ncbi:MAG: serine hydrolase [Verrucomicrobia bacterium]|nr:serine hydrolase [Verrucomicrobiota bacterium]
MALPLYEINIQANEALKMFHVPGMAISVVVNDQIILSRGYGSCSVHEEVPVTEKTLFPIGSGTKAFTALALGQLVEEGKVAWDDPVKKYIPEFALFDLEATEQLTVRDLLAHRTGIARHDPLWFFSEMPRGAVLDLLPHLEPACGLRETFQYSNLMYAVAGIVIERVTGRSWEEVIADRLFKPLEMRDANFSIQHLQESSAFSFPHAEIDGVIKQVPFRNAYPVNPAGGINANLVDLTKWLKFQLSQGAKPIVQLQMFKELHAIQMAVPSSPYDNPEVYHVGYALGWFVGKYRGHDSISHAGDIDGFSSEIFFLPKEKIGLVILTNSSSDGRYVISSLRNQIVDNYLGARDIDSVAKAQEMRDKNKQRLEQAFQAFQAPHQEAVCALGDYLGSYEHPAYGVVTLSEEKNRLFLAYGKVKIPLSYKEEDVFAGQVRDLLVYGINPLMDFSFFRDASGAVCKMEIPFEGFRSVKPITFTFKRCL